MLQTKLILFNNSIPVVSNKALCYRTYDIVNPTYLAYGHTYNSGYIYHLYGSQDGLEWLELNQPDTNSWKGFVCVPNLYVGFRSYNFAISPNGQDWTILDVRNLLGPQAVVGSVVARPSKGDFMIVYKSTPSTSSYPQVTITRDFQTFSTPVALPSYSYIGYVNAAGDYFFLSYYHSYQQTINFFYFNEETPAWVNFTSNIPNVYTGSYSLNSWTYSGANPISFDGTYYRIVGRGAPSASSPIYRHYRAIQSVTRNPTASWTSTTVGDLWGAENNYGGGAYMFQHVTQNNSWYAENKRNFFKLNGSSSTLLSTSSTSPLYYFFSPVGAHTFCWEQDYTNIRRIVNSTLYEVAFPEPITVEASNLTCIYTPS